MTKEHRKFLLTYIQDFGVMHPHATLLEIQDLTPFYETSLNLNSLGELEIGYPEITDNP